MSEDFHEKTEEPTQKKLADARKKGFAARSQDLTISVLLVFTTGLLYFSSGYMYVRLERILLNIFQNLNYPFDSHAVVSAWFQTILFDMFWILFPAFVGVFAVGVLINVVQTGFIFSFYPLMPQLKRVNPFHPPNYEKNFGSAAFVRLGFGLIRINLVVILSYVILGVDAFHVFSMVKGSPKDILLFIHREATLVAMGIALSYLAVGVIDLVYQRWRFTREMRMTRREVKDEIKQLEGDINVKSKIRSMMRTYAENNIQQVLPFADVIIAEGNDYVLALFYDPLKLKAPICLCKGSRNRGQRIRYEARKYEIPIVENAELARGLYREVAETALIPKSYYSRIAAILARVQENSSTRW
jgi:flagellar biosynthetic protein FlhB